MGLQRKSAHEVSIAINSSELKMQSIVSDKISIFQKIVGSENQGARFDWIRSSAHADIRKLVNSVSANQTCTRGRQ